MKLTNGKAFARRLALFAGLVLAPAAALAQGAILQGGPNTPGHAPMYVGSGQQGTQTVVQDSGPAGGGGVGLGLSETLQVNRGAAGTGTGPLGTHNCHYDAPITSSAGYHYLCWDANAQSQGLIVYGAGGAASALPFGVTANGVSVRLPLVPGTIWATISGTTATGHAACFNDSTGVLHDCGALPGTGTVTQIIAGAGLSGGTITTSGTIAIAAQAGNTILGNATAGSAVPSALAIGSCSGAADALTWTTNTGFGCNNASSVVSSKTGTFTVANGEIGATIALGGNAFYAVAFLAASNYTSPLLKTTLVNTDTLRAKYITLPGYKSIYLWPGQTLVPYAENGNWHALEPGPWKPPSGIVNFYTDYGSGSDIAGTTDGLSAAQPFKTAENAATTALSDIICPEGVGTTNNFAVVVNLAANRNDGDGLHLSFHDFMGCQGGGVLQIVGASLPVLGAANNGSGLIRLTLASTSGYSTGQVVAVYTVGGTTEANGAWSVTVIDGTHLDLQGSTFTHAYTTGGTITQGSGIQTTNTDAVGTYFGMTVQFSNLLMQAVGAGSCFNAQWHSNIYITAGVIVGNCATAHFQASGGAKIEVVNDYGIGYQSTKHVFVFDGGIFNTNGNITASYLPSAPNTFTTFIQSDHTGIADIRGLVFALNGGAVTGLRCNANTLGMIDTGTGTPNAVIPGNVNCTSSLGGIVNYLLKRDLDPAANDNAPMWLDQAA